MKQKNTLNHTIEFNCVVSEIEVSYKPVMKVSEMPLVKNSKEVYSLFLQSWDKSKLEFVEQFKVMLLNQASRVLGICLISSGHVTGTIADPKLIFGIAMKTNAVSIILAHNHPSGHLKPSNADTLITNKMVECGRYMDLKVWDHLIISSEGYYSFADEGAL